MSSNPDSIDEIKQRVAIVDAVTRSGLTVVGQGRIRTTQEHDSLKLWTATNTWNWFSQGVGGDVFDWWMQAHHCGFRQALEELARIAGVELQPLTPERQAEVDAARAGRRILDMAAAHYHDVLMNHPGARAARHYCEDRGWTSETIVRERLGYVLAAKDEENSEHNNQLFSLSHRLSEAGLMSHPMAKAVLSMPQGHLVYVHQVGGQAVYLSGRSIEGKRHYNLPADLAGARQPYYNQPVRMATDALFVVEGQADAVALGQVGVGALALCGVEAGDIGIGQDEMGAGLVVNLDSDEAGRTRALAIAEQFGPLARVLTWPQPAKDAADAVKQGLDTESLLQELELSATTVEALAIMAGRTRGTKRKEALNRLLTCYRKMEGKDKILAADMQTRIAKHVGGVAQFKRLLDAQEKQDKANGDSPSRYESSSGAFIGGRLFEQCVEFLPDGRVQTNFAVRLAGGEVKQMAMVDVGDVTYVPYPTTMGLISKRVVLFPSKPEAYGSQKELLADVQAYIHRYLDIDRFYEKLASYYVLFTWVYDLFETLPYLRALGDYGTGKSRFLQTIGALCYRPMFVSGASTVSPVFRIIDMFRGTLVIDEADFTNSDTDAEIMKILNVGYQRGGVVLRAEKDPNSSDDAYWPAAKDVFGPKVLATRKLFVDRATESRCLTKRMSTARPRPDIPYILGSDFWAEALSLRNRLLMYRLKNYKPVHVDGRLADMSIEPRLNQVTMALKAIVDDQEVLGDLTTFVRAYNDTLIADRQLTLPAILVQVLADIWYSASQNLLGEDGRDFTMKHISGRAQKILDDLDPDVKISPNKATKMISEDLGLQRRGKAPKSQNRRMQVLFDEEELLNLMSRYGVERPESAPVEPEG